MVKVTKKTKISKKKIKSKKITPKKIIKKQPIIKNTTPKKQSSGVEKQLIENFVALQRVMVNLSIKFDNLSTQISKLLEVFEISAKALAEKDFDLGQEKVSGKIDTLLDQNKIIARGLTMMHDRVIQPQMMAQPQMMQIPVPQPQMYPPQIPQPTPPAPQAVTENEEDLRDIADYEKSVSSQDSLPQKKFKKL